MGFKDKVKEWAGGDLTFLSDDGDSVKFVVAGDPELIEGRFKGSDTKRAAIPIFTPDGQSLLIVGMRVVRRLAKVEDKHNSHAFILTRNGIRNDQNATYDLAVLDDPETVKKLLALKKAGLDKDELADSLQAAKDAAKG